MGKEQEQHYREALDMVQGLNYHAKFSIIRQMQTRPLRDGEEQKIAELHGRAGYGFALPRLKDVEIVEEDGQIVAAAGYELVAQVYSIVNTEVGALPRILAIQRLHRALASKVLAQDVQEVYAFCDPAFPAFGRRLKHFGWNRKIWPCYFLERGEIERAYLPQKAT